MNDHVGKPIERDKLQTNIRRWLPKANATRMRVDPESAHFHEETFEEFVLLVGEDKARHLIEKYHRSLSKAFKSTFSESQKEAHDLLNVAGVLGLRSLVKACRKVADFAPTPEAPDSHAAVRGLLKVQSTACELVMSRMLPRLRSAQTPAMSRSA
jgi:HPt (histidine-containing phosphotransfer) domain-containing protein